MFLAFQFHMVGRIDDCVQFRLKTKENLKPNLRFASFYPDTMSAVLVQECQARIMRGMHQINSSWVQWSHSIVYYFNLAIHLETEGMSLQWQLTGPENDWVFPLAWKPPIILAPNAKNKAYRILHDEVWSGSEFNKLSIIGLIGTHSLRKYPSTHA